MRVRWTAKVPALGLLLCAGAAGAETEAGPVEVRGFVEAGGLGSTNSTGSSKFEEYRDLSTGFWGNARLTVDEKEGRHYFEGLAGHIGRRDQSYFLTGGRYGSYQLKLGFDEVPHVFSNAAQSLYLNPGDARLILSQGTQAFIQAGRSTALQSALADAAPVSLRYQQRTGNAGFSYRPLSDVEVSVGYQVLQRSGTHPFGMAFGSPGGNFVNVAAPINERTHDLLAAVELAKEIWNARLEYDGSFFRNSFESLIVDNPLLAADSPTAGATRGRTVLPPNNEAHTLSLAGSVAPPWGFPFHAAATLSYGVRLQNAAFLPNTINTALVSPDLSASSLGGAVRTYLANVSLSARPASRVDLRAGYRFFDYTSDFGPQTFDGHVINDQTLESEPLTTTPIGYQRQNAGLDLGVRLASPLRAKIGYQWDRWGRSPAREVRALNEHAAKAAIDYLPSKQSSLRLGYRFGFRRYGRYDTFAPLAHSIEEQSLPEAEPQFQSILLRKFDEADRYSHRANLMARHSFTEKFSAGLLGAFGVNNYDRSPLGLLNDKRWTVGADATCNPTERLSLSIFYTFEDIQANQESRWRPRTFTAPPVVIDDSINDWSSFSEDRVQTAGAWALAVLLPEKLDLKLSYVVERGTGRTHAVSVLGFVDSSGGSRPPDGGNAVDWPDINDTQNYLVATFRYTPIEHFSLKAEYRFELFAYGNFKTSNLQPFMPNSNVNGSGVESPSIDVFLGDRVPPYLANVGTVSAIYEF